MNKFVPPFFFAMLGLAICCADKHMTNKYIDKFINKYDNYNFGIPKDVAILMRSKNLHEEVYVVGKYAGNRPPYFVTYDIQKGHIAEIDSSGLLALNELPYFTNEELSNLIDSIKFYNFYHLAFDSLGNFFVNPFLANAPPLLMRRQSTAMQDTIREGFVYKKYKNNWYVNIIER